MNKEKKVDPEKDVILILHWPKTEAVGIAVSIVENQLHSIICDYADIAVDNLPYWHLDGDFSVKACELLDPLLSGESLYSTVDRVLEDATEVFNQLTTANHEALLNISCNWSVDDVRVIKKLNDSWVVHLKNARKITTNGKRN